MAESDGEIECLEEDYEIVKQCVQPNVTVLPPAIIDSPDETLLVERRQTGRKRKWRKQEEEDSDYDPTEEFVPPSPPSLKNLKNVKNLKKKKTPQPKRKVFTNQIRHGQIRNNQIRHSQSQRTPKPTPAHVPEPKIVKKVKEPPPLTPEELLVKRKESTITIPDYDDPLCLPVRAIKQEESDINRLTNWNNVCLEHFKHCDTMLKPERGKTKNSSREIVFRNHVNKRNGKTETTLWSKTCVSSEEGDKKSELFQCILPRYKEKKTLYSYNLINKRPKPFHIKDEIILSKEDHKDGEALVTYKPSEALAAVYKLVKKSSDPKNEDYDDDDEDKTHLKELTCTKVCAPCFQRSWRGVRESKNKSLLCPICVRTSASLGSLLAHYRTHTSEDLRAYKKLISTALAEIVDYHYKCRICREKFDSIKKLRLHVLHHQTEVPFTCEVGDHFAV